MGQVLSAEQQLAALSAAMVADILELSGEELRAAGQDPAVIIATLRARVVKLLEQFPDQITEMAHD